MTTSERLAEIKARVERAHREICDLAAYGGRERWRMSIPVRSDDSDMTLQAPLDDVPDLVLALEVAIEALNHYDTAHYDDCGNVCVHDDTADEALAKIEAMLAKGDK